MSDAEGRRVTVAGHRGLAGHYAARALTERGFEVRREEAQTLRPGEALIRGDGRALLVSPHGGAADLVLHTGLVLGSDPAGTGFVERAVRWARSPRPFFVPEGEVNVVAGAVVGEAVVAALSSEREGRLDLGDENLSWRRLLTRIADLAGSQRRARALPALAFRAFDRTSSPGIDWTARRFDSRPARDALGLRLGGIDAAIREAVDAMA